MNTQEQRERWAKMLGWRDENQIGAEGKPLWRAPYKMSEPDINGNLWNWTFPMPLPDFTALDGPYVGPAVKELIDAGWHPYKPIPRHFSFYRWELGSQVLADDDFGICTMIALEKKREMDAQVQP